MILSTITKWFSEIKNVFGSIKRQRRVKHPCNLNPHAECPNKLIYENGGMRRELEGIRTCCQTFYQQKRSAEIESQLKPNTDYNGISFTKGYIDSVKRTWQRIKDVDYCGPLYPKYRVQKLDIDMTKTDKKSDIEKIRCFLNSLLDGHDLDYLHIDEKSIVNVGLDAISIEYVKHVNHRTSMSKIYFLTTINPLVESYIRRKNTIDNILKLEYGKYANDLILLFDILEKHATYTEKDSDQ